MRISSGDRMVVMKGLVGEYDIYDVTVDQTELRLNVGEYARIKVSAKVTCISGGGYEKFQLYAKACSTQSCIAYKVLTTKLFLI